MRKNIKAPVHYFFFSSNDSPWQVTGYNRKINVNFLKLFDNQNFFPKEFLVWWQGQGHKLISPKKIVTIPEFSSRSAPKRRNLPALFGILSSTFMNEIRTGMCVPGVPSSPTAFAKKKIMLPYMGNAKMISICQVCFH